jgi:hypothetical protein
MKRAQMQVVATNAAGPLDQPEVLKQATNVSSFVSNGFAAGELFFSPSQQNSRAESCAFLSRMNLC